MTARYAAALILSVLIAGCIGDLAIGEEVPVHGFRVVAVHPHDPEAFTQGLDYRDGVLYEGTGLYGRSSLRETVLETGEVLRYRALPDQLYGEGIVLLEDRIVQLTWRSGVGLVWDLEDLTVIDTFFYTTEGWGITSNGESLIMSDGTSTLRFLDPETYQVEKELPVLAAGEPLALLNELEYVDGLIYANVWKTDRIAVISPDTGVVAAWIDLSGILTREEQERADVLNGIAHDPETGRLFVTGKLWPKLFEIEVVKSERSRQKVA